MSRAEYIIWRVETKMEVEREHPQWTTQMVNDYVNKVEDSLKCQGLMTIEQKGAGAYEKNKV